MAQTVFASPDEIPAAVGRHLGTTGWVPVSQAQVDRFAQATGDRQWIHVDAERARRESPHGGPIAHGYLVLSLTNLFLPQLVEVQGVSMGVNYGTGRVRFPAPVPVPGRVRGSATLAACDEVRGGVQTTIRITVEVDADGSGTPGPEPACVADSLSRWLRP